MEYSLYIAEEVFNNIKKDYEEHDKSCSSIPHMWLGRHGGVSCFGDESECDGCQVTFFWEGLTQYGTVILTVASDDDIEEIDAYYCDCCLRKIKEKHDG